MAGYFDQCACGEYTCVGDTPCRRCLEAEINRLREALEQIRDMPNRIYEGFSADGECSSHVVVAPDARKMQSIAEQALEGGDSDGC